VMQLNICEDEGGGVGLRPGAQAPLPICSSYPQGPLYTRPQTLSKRSWSVLKVKKEQHQSPMSCVLGKSISGIFQPFF